jgi:primosomal protein N' (replication factor Y)
VLVPEISLTPQLVQRYRARFGNDLAVWHSGLSERERFNQWRLLRSGKVKVAVGVRSAVFAPVENLGIIIVDEEHDGSFKQDRGFHYHARDLALLRAARQGAAAVLGSATPSLETLHNVTLGKLTRLELNTRATDQPLPPVEIVDLSVHRSGPLGQTTITLPLFAAMSNALERGEQIILFLNRRGFAPALLCTQCGDLLKCRYCAVSMTYHKAPPKLVCH